MLNKNKTVTSHSATLIGKRRMYLDTGHSGLNKFRGEDDENFQLFIPTLKEIVDHAIAHHHKGLYQSAALLLALLIVD
jgi:hypothetical protein